jgi:hypothetical protein
MKLKGDQSSRLADALSSAFPAELDGMNRVVERAKLGRSFADFRTAVGTTYQQALGSLVIWVNSQNRVEDLLLAARQENPGNLELLALFNELSSSSSRLGLRGNWQTQELPSKPINLPYDSIGSLFKGREALLADLRRRLGVPKAGGTAIVNRVVVHGLGGIGKTRGALEYAWQHADDYAALLFVSAPSVAELHANVAGLSDALGMTVEKVSIDRQLTDVLRWLDEHPVGS